MDTLRTQILSRYSAADTYLETKRTLWTEYENIFHNKLDDEVSGTTKSQVFDPKLSTYVLERSYRVMAQLMQGKVKAISKNDEAASELMNLILEKYILPNANAQYDFLTKARLVDTYSNIYGNFFAMVDWDVRKDGYVGPDMWLINIRDVFPQVGAVSLDDSDYIIIRSWRPLSYFENLTKRDSFKNVSSVVAKLKDKSGDKQSRDAKSMSEREINDYPGSDTVKGKGYYEVLSMYEKDRWCDYVPSAKEFIRDTKPPEGQEGELPVVNKYSIPLLDDFMAMGDFERGKSMQYLLNSSWNLYLDAVKISIFPPVLLNKDNVASMSSIKYGPAAKWLVRNQINNVAQTLQLSPQGVATFNNVYQLANSSIQNMFGTSDTSIAQDQDITQGKTPQALKMQQSRQNSRDVTDRFYQEQFLTKVMKKFVNLISKKQSKGIQLRLFKDEIEALSRQYPEIQDMFDEKTGKLTVDKKTTGSILYDYEIVPGSTYAVDEQEQQKNLGMLLQVLTQSPQILQALDMEGKRVNFGELLTRMGNKAGIQGWDKIIYNKDKEMNPNLVLADHAKQFQQAMQGVQGMQGGMQGGILPGEVPPQPPMQGGLNEASPPA